MQLSCNRHYIAAKENHPQERKQSPAFMSNTLWTDTKGREPLAAAGFIIYLKDIFAGNSRGT